MAPEGFIQQVYSTYQVDEQLGLPALPAAPFVQIAADNVLGKAISFLDLPFQLFAMAAISSRSSSVSFPHCSFTLPFACFQFPSMRFQSMTFLHGGRFLDHASRVRCVERRGTYTLHWADHDAAVRVHTIR